MPCLYFPLLPLSSVFTVFQVCECSSGWARVVSIWWVFSDFKDPAWGTWVTSSRWIKRCSRDISLLCSMMECFSAAQRNVFFSVLVTRQSTEKERHPNRGCMLGGHQLAMWRKLPIPTLNPFSCFLINKSSIYLQWQVPSFKIKQIRKHFPTSLAAK